MQNPTFRDKPPVYTFKYIHIPLKCELILYIQFGKLYPQNILHNKYASATFLLMTVPYGWVIHDLLNQSSVFRHLRCFPRFTSYRQYHEVHASRPRFLSLSTVDIWGHMSLSYALQDVQWYPGLCPLDACTSPSPSVVTNMSLDIVKYPLWGKTTPR